MMKDNLASLEANFVDFNQNTENTKNEFSVQLPNKDKEINQLKSEITNLKTDKSNNQQLISDIILKQVEIQVT